MGCSFIYYNPSINNRYIKWGIKKWNEVFKIQDIIMLIINGINLSPASGISFSNSYALFKGTAVSKLPQIRSVGHFIFFTSSPILYLLPFLLYIIIISKKNLHILQQHFYNENNRYIKWGIKKWNEVFKTVSKLPQIRSVGHFIFFTSSPISVFTDLTRTPRIVSLAFF